MKQNKYDDSAFSRRIKKCPGPSAGLGLQGNGMNLKYCFRICRANRFSTSAAALAGTADMHGNSMQLKWSA